MFSQCPNGVKMQVLHYGTLWDIYGRLWDIYGFRTGLPKCRFCQNMGFLWEEYGILWVIMGFVWEEYGIFLISHFSPTTSDEIPIKMLKLSSFCISPAHSDLVVSIRNSFFRPNVEFANTTTVAVCPMPFGALRSVHHHPPSSLPDLGEGYLSVSLPGMGAAGCTLEMTKIGFWGCDCTCPKDLVLSCQEV